MKEKVEKKKDEKKNEEYVADAMKTVYEEQMKLHPEIYNKNGEQ